MSILVNSDYIIDESLDVLTRWDKIGFLDYVKEPFKEKVANAMQLAVYLFRNKYVRINNRLTDTVTFSAISTLYKIDSELIINERFEFTEEKMLQFIYAIDDCINSHTYNVHSFHKDVDVEANLIKLFCELYVESENNKIKELYMPAWNTSWDYLGHNVTDKVTEYTQYDWNQTLITKINQISAQIHKTCFHEANKVILNSNLFLKLINDLEFYNFKTKMIGEKYLVEVDNSIKENVILVKCDNFGDDIKTYYNPNFEQPFILIHENSSNITDEIKINPKYTIITEKKLNGKIKIENI